MGSPAGPVFTPDQYSRSATVDLETAISLAVERVISQPYPRLDSQGVITLAEIYSDWPTMDDEFVSPSAVILPQDELLYGPSHLTPRLLEDSWEPRGQNGFGLYELSEGTREFQLQVRSGVQAERNALKAGIEGAFVASSVIAVPPPNPTPPTVQAPSRFEGQRYGIIVRVPEYWNLPVRLTLKGSHKLDDADLAAKNQWAAEFRIEAQAPHVVLRPVPAFRVKFRQVEVGDTVKIGPRGLE
jgi:hypothetical protein